MSALPHPLGRGRRGRLAALVCVGVAQAAFAIGTALLVQLGFDALVRPGVAVHPSWTVGIATGIAAMAGGMALARGLERALAERLGQSYAEEVRDRLLEHLGRMTTRGRSGLGRGGVLSRFVGDLTAVRQWVSLGLARLAVSGVVVVLVVAALLVLAPVVGVAVAVVLLVAGVATAAVTPGLRNATEAARRRRARMTGEVVDRLDHLATVQASGQVDRERRRMRRAGERVTEAAVDRAHAIGMLRALAEAAGGIAAGAALVVGAAAVQAGQLSAGAVVASMTAAALLATQLRDLGRVVELASAHRVAMVAIRRTLAAPSARRSTTPSVMAPAALSGPRAAARVRLEHVRVADVLGGRCPLDVTVEPGTTVAIVGPNGAGKSTLLRLATGLDEPDEGRVLLAGRDLVDWEDGALRATIGAAGPQLPLLRGSLRRSVAYRHPDATQEELDAVASLCGLADVLADVGGWDARIGQAGSRMSAGQQARATLARAVLGAPGLLVLDEPDAHLDAADGILARVLAAHAGTALVVTHDERTARLADELWCIVDGELVERGDPAVLLASGGPSARALGIVPLLAPEPVRAPAIAAS